MKYLVALSLLLGACGGSAPDPYNETHQGELTEEDPKVPEDQSPYDTYDFEADRGWTITVDMESPSFATYLWLLSVEGGMRERERSLVQMAPAQSTGNNSRIVYTAPERGKYRVRANSYEGTGRGAYTLRISAQPSS